MKVIAFNGSPHAEGNTYHALRIVLAELEKEGIETEIICVGQKALIGCQGCHACAKKRDGSCAFGADGVNEWIGKIREADGILLGSPVHFSGVSGAMKCFLDRATFVSGNCGGLMRHKVGASVAAVRRAGSTATLDQLDRYLSYSEMFLVGSNYWNMAFGLKPGQVNEDPEGVQTMQVLGRNMAYLLKLREAGKDIPAPEGVRKEFTNMIR